MEYIHGGLVYVLFNMRARLHEQTVEFSQIDIYGFMNYIYLFYLVFLLLLAASASAVYCIVRMIWVLLWLPYFCKLRQIRNNNKKSVERKRN